MRQAAVTVAGLPSPAGPYSPSVRSGPWIHTSGQGGASADGALAPDIESQTKQCLANVLAALEASGATERDVVKVTVYLTDRADFGAMNDEFRAAFTEPYPARTTVFVGLAEGLLVEIDAVAYLDAQL